MRVYGPHEAEIRAIASEVGLQIWNDSIRRRGRWYTFRLKLGQERLDDGRLKFQKISQYGARTPFVCWHGHREFFFALFRSFPEAIVDTSIAYYDGRERFRMNYRASIALGNDYNYSPDYECTCPVPTVRRLRRARLRGTREAWPRVEDVHHMARAITSTFEAASANVYEWNRAWTRVWNQASNTTVSQNVTLSDLLGAAPSEPQS